MKYFDRYACMDENTMKILMGAINSTYSIKNSFPLRNYLSGLFDGFDYTSQINEEIRKLDIPSQLVQEIQQVLNTIATYPKTTNERGE